MVEERGVKKVDVEEKKIGDREFEEADLMEMSQDQLVELFVDKMIADKGETMSEAQRELLVTQLKDAVMAEILMNLPDYLVNKVNDAYEEDNVSDDLFDSIIEEAGINTEEIAEKVMIRFRDDFLKDIKREED